MSSKPGHTLPGLTGICGRQQGQAGQSSQTAYVLHAVVRISEIAIGHAGPDSHHSYWQFVVAHIVANLLKAPERREVADAVGKHVKTFAGEASCQACHVLFSNPRIQVTAPDRPKGSVELKIGNEFIGTIHRDAEDGDVSYAVQIVVLAEDLLDND